LLRDAVKTLVIGTDAREEGFDGGLQESDSSLWSMGYNNYCELGDFFGNARANYALNRSFTLSPPNWIPQVTNPADANGNLVFTNRPDSTTNNFWRIRSMP